MTSELYVLMGFLYFAVGFFTFIIGLDCSKPKRAFRPAVFWPLYGLKFLVVQTFIMLKEVFEIK